MASDASLPTAPGLRSRAALALQVRFHSFYPWHDKGAYTHLMAPGDEKTLEWVKEFNKFDLYSKSDALPDKEALKPYYHTLLEKYNISGKLKF